jgi:hypothetical protein
MYKDSDWAYEVYFKKNGTIITTHPNDKTKENDFWEQNDTSIVFSFNDKSSNYKAQRIGKDTIKGKEYIQNDSCEFVMVKKR